MVIQKFSNIRKGFTDSNAVALCQIYNCFQTMCHSLFNAIVKHTQNCLFGSLIGVINDFSNRVNTLNSRCDYIQNIVCGLSFVNLTKSVCF